MEGKKLPFFIDINNKPYKIALSYKTYFIIYGRLPLQPAQNLSILTKETIGETL